MAVKAFRLDLPPERAAELAAILETLVTDQPRHPAIAAAVAAGVEGSTAWLAQEYVPGEALDAVLRGFGPPPPAEALVTLTRIAEALDRAAGEGIHHGVLHPRDILVDEGGDARVIDIGVAQALERCHIRPPVRRPYSAPERTRDAWDGAADIYSLGAIAFELITGRRLAGPGRPAVSSPVLSHVAADEIATALERALAVDPAERYPSAADLVDALAPALRTVRRTPGARRKGAPVVAGPLLPLESDQGAGAEQRPGAEQGPVARDQGPVGKQEIPADVQEPAAAPPSPPAEPPPAEPEVSAVPRFLAPTPVSAPEPDAGASTDDLPLTAATAEQSRFFRLDDDEPAMTREPVHEPEPRHEPEREEPPNWHLLASPPSIERRPFLPILMALVVGIAAGFGWGYWTAWRSQELQAGAGGTELPAAVADAGTAPAPDRAAPGANGPVTVEDPEVVGERGLPPTTAAGAAGTSRSGSAPARGAQPAPPAPARTEPAPRTQAAAPPRETAPAQPAPAAVSGRLTIRSTPPGARVLVDGRLRGRTPLNITDLPLRAVQVTVAQPGYAPDERRVVLSAGQPHVVINAQLTREGAAATARTGSLVVESRPVGAAVFLDNRQIGVTPLSVPGLAPGTYRIRLELNGFNPWITATEVRPGDRTRVAASLEPGGTRE